MDFLQFAQTNGLYPTKDVELINSAVAVLKPLIDEDNSNSVSANEFKFATGATEGIRGLLTTAIQQIVAQRDADAAAAAVPSPSPKTVTPAIPPKAAAAPAGSWPAFSFDCPPIEPLLPNAKVQFADRSLAHMTKAQLEQQSNRVLADFCRERFSLGGSMGKAKTDLVSYILEYCKAVPATLPTRREVTTANTAAKQDDVTWRNWSADQVDREFSKSQLQFMVQERLPNEYRSRFGKAELIELLFQYREQQKK